MKHWLIAAMICTTLPAISQELTSDQFDKLEAAVVKGSCKATYKDADVEAFGSSGGYDFTGRAAIAHLQKEKYREHTLFDLAMHYCVLLPKPLGSIDRWRYQSCRQDAAKAPTAQGVALGLRICAEKFKQ